MVPISALNLVAYRAVPGPILEPKIVPKTHQKITGSAPGAVQGHAGPNRRPPGRAPDTPGAPAGPRLAPRTPKNDPRGPQEDPDKAEMVPKRHPGHPNETSHTAKPYCTERKVLCPSAVRCFGAKH